MEVEGTEENDGGKVLYDIESLELSVNKPLTKYSCVFLNWN